MASCSEAEQDGPGAEFMDTTRQKLIEQLNAVLIPEGGVEKVSQEAWAFLWLADIQRLRGLLQEWQERQERRVCYGWFSYTSSLKRRF